ncbi:hypothetical protein T4D_10531 [Trichinella pseudospiralis]|uniref:Uncharacterized protein n=1 Tax=Trichinella pseudospiralis TaxID=6337 RepID=A0A0V1FSQ6_TRIPS|nr:hypothetical protein T4D_10531 [Trichinella pseudospiralis]
MMLNQSMIWMRIFDKNCCQFWQIDLPECFNKPAQTGSFHLLVLIQQKHRWTGLVDRIADIYEFNHVRAVDLHGQLFPPFVSIQPLTETQSCYVINVRH